MARLQEVLLSANDAEALALMLEELRRGQAMGHAAELLDELLMEARLVPEDKVPPDRVRMNSHVTYQEEPDGERRSVTLVHPSQADAAEGRISVLTPVGLALLGRKQGEEVAAAMPGGRELKIRILN